VIAAKDSPCCTNINNEQKESNLKTKAMKSVILFNRRELTYAVVGMNYTDEDASLEVDKVKHLGGFHVDQMGKAYESESELDSRINEITGGKVIKVEL
jgi:hypothetical protein